MESLITWDLEILKNFHNGISFLKIFSYGTGMIYGLHWPLLSLNLCVLWLNVCSVSSSSSWDSVLCFPCHNYKYFKNIRVLRVNVTVQIDIICSQSILFCSLHGLPLFNKQHLVPLLSNQKQMRFLLHLE